MGGEKQGGAEGDSQVLAWVAGENGGAQDKAEHVSECGRNGELQA